MSFAHPQILWLLVVFPPALVVFLWWSWRNRQSLMTQFIQARLLPGLISGLSPAREKARAAALVLAVACVILALARPQWGFTWEEVRQRGLDIVAAIDTSKSMLAEDIAPNRLARAKLAALDLMQQAKSDRLGVVAFAGSAFLSCPLTIDDAAFRQSVEALGVGTMSEGGTAVAQAIETALGAFKEGDNYKVLVLFTDGEDHDSGALEAAQAAARAGLQIFTIGIGTTDGELLRVKDAGGRTDYVRDEQGNVVKSHLNEDLLRKIAGATEKGFYLPLRGAKTIETLYQQGLAPLPKTEGKEKLVKRYQERFHWPLALAIALLLVEILLPERKRHRKATTPSPAPQPALRPAATLLLLLALPLALGASPSSALREYKQGQFDQALKDYDQLLRRKPDDPRLQFNAGAAAYRNRQFGEAARRFSQALAAPDLGLQGLAYYNRGNSLYRLGEAAPDPGNKAEQWEKSLQDFQSAKTLNPQDGDAKHNYDFVKQRLEELKQQQQQQQQSKQDKQQQKQDQQPQPNQQKQDQQKPDEQKDQQQQPQQAQQNQPEQKPQTSPQPQPSEQQKQEDQKQQPSAGQSPEQKEKPPPPPEQAAGQSKDKPQEKERQEAAANPTGQMTPEQAQQLLDAQKGDEQMLQFKPEGKPRDRTRPIKDW